MDILKAAPEQLAKFLNFVLRFAANPRRALEAYAPPGANASVSVSGDLILFCGLSVGCGVLIVALGQAVGMADDRSQSVLLLRRLDAKVLPLLVALAIVVASSVWHAFSLAIGSVLSRLQPEVRFQGSIVDSINAGLAFGTFYILLLTPVVVATRIGAKHSSLPPIVYGILGLPLAGAFLFYFVASFAAVHRVAAGKYYVLFSFTVIALLLLADWLA